MRTLQIILAVLIGIVVSVFAFQNMAPVSISFAGASARVPLIVLIAGLLILGFILGKIVRIWPRAKSKHRSERSGASASPARKAAPPPPPAPSFSQPPKH